MRKPPRKVARPEKLLTHVFSSPCLLLWPQNELSDCLQTGRPWIHWCRKGNPKAARVQAFPSQRLGCLGLNSPRKQRRGEGRVPDAPRPPRGAEPAGPEPLGGGLGLRAQHFGAPQSRGAAWRAGGRAAICKFSHPGPASASCSLPSWKLDHWTRETSDLLWPGVCASHLSQLRLHGVSALGGLASERPGTRGGGQAWALSLTPAGSHTLSSRSQPSRATLGCVSCQDVPSVRSSCSGLPTGPSPHPSISPDSSALNSAFTSINAPCSEPREFDTSSRAALSAAVYKRVSDDFESLMRSYLRR